MRRNSVEVDIAAWQYVNLWALDNFFTIIFFIIFLWKQSVSEVSGPHDMEAIKKKNHNSCLLIYI